MGSFSYMIGLILWLGVVLYTPSLALHTITGLPEVALILLGGIVVTIYTVMVIFFDYPCQIFKKHKNNMNCWQQ